MIFEEYRKTWIKLKIIQITKNDSKNNVVKNSRYTQIYQYRKLHKIS